MIHNDGVKVWVEHKFHKGPGKGGTFFKIGSWYEWNAGKKWGKNEVWVEHRAWKGPGMSGTLFIESQVWVDRFEIFKCFSCKIPSLHNFRLSPWTGNEHIFQERNLKILKRSTHTWPQLNNVPLIPGPFYARCSTHTWTSFLPAFHSYHDPILKMTLPWPLPWSLPWPHHYECSIHTWTPPIEFSQKPF